jgi:hypothetical protein
MPANVMMPLSCEKLLVPEPLGLLDTEEVALAQKRWSVRRVPFG